MFRNNNAPKVKPQSIQIVYSKPTKQQYALNQNDVPNWDPLITKLYEA